MGQEEVSQLIGDVSKPDAETIETYKELIERADTIPTDIYLEYDQVIKKSFSK